MNTDLESYEKYRFQEILDTLNSAGFKFVEREVLSRKPLMHYETPVLFENGEEWCLIPFDISCGFIFYLKDEFVGVEAASFMYGQPGLDAERIVLQFYWLSGNEKFYQRILRLAFISTTLGHRMTCIIGPDNSLCGPVDQVALKMCHVDRLLDTFKSIVPKPLNS